MRGWAVHAVPLPFGDRPEDRWIDESGSVLEQPALEAELLPGRYVLSGLVDAHAHPAVAPGPSGFVAQDAAGAEAQLLAWAETGVAIIRDVGSPRGLTLELNLGSRAPLVWAAGRFLAPAGRYFPQLLVDPVDEDELIDTALAEIARGATWVKVIGDFPRLQDGADAARTYSLDLIERLSSAVHAEGARVAVHATLRGCGEYVTAGVDSIEHGPGLDPSDLGEMARRGVAWVPTLCAVLAGADDPDAPPERRARVRERQERLRELLPLAVRTGVPVLAGTDVVGSLSREVALLAAFGLDPAEALAAASVWPRRFLGGDVARADIVTYDNDPREAPDELARPAAVVVGGIRLR